MRKSLTAVIILAIFYTSGNIKSQYLTSLKLNDSKTDTVLHKSTQVKSPELAGFLSLIVPGLALGHVYNEQPEKFALHFGISGLCVLGFFMGIPFNPGGSSPGSETVSLMMILSVSVYMVNWVWSIADAVSSANEINRLAAEKEKHTGILNKLRFGISIDKNRKFNLKFAIGL